MKPKDLFPSPAAIRDGVAREAGHAISDIRSALIDEAWFDRTSASVTHIQGSPLGWEQSDDRRSEQRAEDPFGHRWSASDHARQPAEREHPHELDFDR